MDPLPCIPVYFVLLVLSALIELAVQSAGFLNQINLRRLAEDGGEKAQKPFLSTEDVDRYIPPAEIGTVFLFAAAQVLILVSCGNVLCGVLLKLPAMQEADGALLRLLSFLSNAAVFLLSAVFYLVLAKILPDKIAGKYAEKLCGVFLPVLHGFAVFFTPLYAVVTFFGSAAARLFGVRPGDVQDDVTEDEIRRMIDEGKESGSIEESKTDMIHSIFEFDDREVGEILTHRTDVVAVELSATLEEVLTLAGENGFSRLPVYKETLDDIVGVLHVKDLLPLINSDSVRKTDGFHLSDYVRKALYVPETTRLKDLFERFRNERIQMAVIIDEYGGTLGIVTMEDLIESIMGSINDEFDREEDTGENNIVRISEREYHVNGLTPIKELEDTLGFPVENPEDCDTVGGLAVSLIGMIPEEGEQPEVVCGALTMRVLSVAEHHVERLSITVNTAQTEGETEEKTPDEAEDSASAQP